MNFDVERNSKYVELFVFEGETRLSTGLMNEDEAIEMVKNLLFAAEMLMPPNMAEEETIQEVREALDG